MHYHGAVLGICVIYLPLNDHGDELIQISLERVARRTAAPFRVYGVALRCSAAQSDRIAAHGVHLVAADLPPQPDDVAEHGELLDLLAARAVADGCDFVATFDLDSWPVVDGWNETYCSLLSEAVPVAAIVRTEVGDNFPFPGFTLLHRSFWKRGASSFRGRDQGVAVRQCTGSGILEQLSRDGQSFLRLERSNAWDPHPLMGGLYDDTMFHLGAGSRRPVFITDGDAAAANDNDSVQQWLLRESRDAEARLLARLAGGPLTRFEPIRIDSANLAGKARWTPRAERRRLERQPSDSPSFWKRMIRAWRPAPPRRAHE